MPIDAEKAFRATMSEDMILASDARAADLLREYAWRDIRAALPSDVRSRLDEARGRRLAKTNPPKAL